MKIKLLAMDVDGTLTDGRIYIGPEGEVMKAFDVKDGYGIVQFKKNGGIPVIITGRQSKIVDQYGLTSEEVAYIGDDLNDLECLNYAGLSACPADAVQSVKEKVDYICRCVGGNGAVREFIDCRL